MAVFLNLLLLLTLVAQSYCFCPENRIHSVGICSLRIYCYGTIRNVSLPSECQGSTNIAVNVDLNLSNAIERFDEHITDTKFLKSTTTFRASGANWSKTNLSFLKYMPRLKHLYLVDNRIRVVKGYPFFELRRLESVDLSHNALVEIDELFQFESTPIRLTKLSLAYNAIQEMPGDAFADMISLKELDLSHNYITDLTEEPFSNLTNLETLRLNNNRITNLNGAVNNLNNLKHLYLRGNKIQNIDESSLNIIYHLETFDVSGNELDYLKPSVFERHWTHFGGTCKIILSENHITFIPNGTSKELTSRFSRDLQDNSINVFTKLDLSKNSITNIEYNAFQSVIKMMSLDLSENKLLDFVVNPEYLVYVNYLNLSSNYLTHLYYESFSSMSNLQNLDLSNNDLNFIPDETFTNNYNLKYVNMSYNDVEWLDKLNIKMFHPEGGVLDLSNNDLSNLNIPIGEGLRLTILVLNSNKISNAALINLIHQSDLIILEMNQNHIQELNKTSLLLPLSLSTLDLSHNKIKKIGPSTFHRVHQLQTLYLSHNHLNSIDYGTFQGLTSLSNLDLSFNKIAYLDSNMLMDLKGVKVLSLRHNGMTNLNNQAWIGHKVDLKVYIEGNNMSCDWLSEALRDFNGGYSKVKFTVHQVSIADMNNSLEGIPCIQNAQNKQNEIGELYDPRSKKYIMADERLLVTNQKILEAVKEQTSNLSFILERLVVQNSNQLELISRLLNRV